MKQIKTFESFLSLNEGYQEEKWHTFADLRDALKPHGFAEDTKMMKAVPGLLQLVKGNDYDGLGISCKPATGEWRWWVSKGGQNPVDKNYKMNLTNYNMIGAEGKKVYDAIMKDFTPYLKMAIRPQPNMG